MVTLLAARG